MRTGTTPQFKIRTRVETCQKIRLICQQLAYQLTCVNRWYHHVNSSESRNLAINIWWNPMYDLPSRESCGNILEKLPEHRALYYYKMSDPNESVRYVASCSWSHGYSGEVTSNVQWLKQQQERDGAPCPDAQSLLWRKHACLIKWNEKAAASRIMSTIKLKWQVCCSEKDQQTGVTNGTNIWIYSVLFAPFLHPPFYQRQASLACFGELMWSQAGA